MPKVTAKALYPKLDYRYTWGLMRALTIRRASAY
jgi:hypothetical protein